MSSHHCNRCNKTTFTCNGTCVILHKKRKNSVSYGWMRQVRQHHLKCHEGLDETVANMEEQEQAENFDCGSDDCRMAPAEESSPNVSSFATSDGGNLLSFSGMVTCDGDESVDTNGTDLIFDQILDDGIGIPEDWPVLQKPRTVAEQFHDEISAGNARRAGSVLVKQAAYQTAVVPAGQLPIPNIMLFLYLARLVMSSGLSQQHYLSKLLLILYPFVDRVEKDWAPIPCTLSGFRSRFLNVSNSNSLVSILPIPAPDTLPDGHGYTPLRNILRHVFSMEQFEPAATLDTKWQSLASSDKFLEFLANVAEKGQALPLGPRKLAVGLLLWTDGWDTSTGCKSNRSPMHTGTITLLIVDVESQLVVGVSTHPNMGGPGKIDHEPVYQRLQEDVAAFESDECDRVFSSRHFLANVEVYTQIIFVVQDQPERRTASGLKGGGSKLHAMFGMSCDFERLILPFKACQDCVESLDAYLVAEDWTRPPMEVRCEYCLGWSLHQLTRTTYRESFEVPHVPTVNEGDPPSLPPPGVHLFHGPGRLHSQLLKAAWDHCIHMYIDTYEWLEADVRKYLEKLCINDATVTNFVDGCRRHLYFGEIEDNPDTFTQEQVAECRADRVLRPESYERPRPPAMWSLGDIKEKTEGSMHLSMGIQKATFKFVIRWATGHTLGSPLQRRLADNLRAIQDLKVAYCPCRPYKDEKFGGFTAEGYRAMTLTSLYIYRVLLETELLPKPPRGENTAQQKQWTR